MNYEELLEYLDIDDPDQFAYFETMADLIESEEYIEMESMFRLFEEADRETVSKLIDEYFDEITGKLPEDSDELFSLLDQIRLCLKGLIDNAADESDLRMFTDEFHRFRQWYVYDSEVEIIPEDGPSELQNVRDAITTARVEKLCGGEYRYNYGKSLDYELDSYTMSFAELAAAEDYNGE